MKIAITGENGFLGYHLTQYYKQKAQVLSLSRNYLDNIQLVKDCDFLIHAAGVNRANSDKEVYEGNINLAIDLINKLTQLNIKIPIKFISSIQENNKNAYGNSKLEAKRILNEYCLLNGVKFESYSLPNLFGTHGKPNYNSFINTFCYNQVKNIPNNYNSSSISLCWVKDAIKVIDNQTHDYKLSTTTVEKVHYIISNFNSISPNDEFSSYLYQIYKHYKNKNMKILVLGHTGMLGSMVKKYFTYLGFQIETINSRFLKDNFISSIENFDGDFIINCIGAIPQRTNNFSINSDLPIFLETHSPCRIIHPGTDCEMDIDDYGISKKAASDYILSYGTKTKILKSSIIGPEQETHYGLMEWFLAQEGEIFGYTQAIWNGNTTLEWAKQCYELITKWDDYEILTILEGQPISKYDMLLLFKTFYNKNITIIPKDLGKNKCLKGNINTKSLKEQLEELKEFNTFNI
jgi:nucleoside-diphosphate-sugar epimerase